MYCIVYVYVFSFAANKPVMDIENTKQQMRKGILEFCILTVISQSDECYATDILETLKNGRLLVVEGTLYPLLTRLKNDGLLNYRWEESKSGPPRKYYQLTPLGERFLDELKNTWNELESSVSNIINKKK